MNIPVAYPYTTLSGNWDTKPEYCLVDSALHGIFGCLYCLLYGLYICIKEEIHPVIFMGSHHHYYEKPHGENVFSYYFDQKTVLPDTRDLPKITAGVPAHFLRWCRSSMQERIIANFLITHFFGPNESIRKRVADFEARHFKNRRVLGVHYRSRDKETESPILAFEFYLDKITSLLDRQCFDKVFFCTDELELRDYLKQRIGSKLCFYDLEADYESHLTVDTLKKEGLHVGTASPFLNGKDAVVECYLLSRCSFLLSSTKSSFSLFATFINPDISHIVLNA